MNEVGCMVGKAYSVATTGPGIGVATEAVFGDFEDVLNGTEVSTSATGISV